MLLALMVTNGTIGKLTNGTIGGIPNIVCSFQVTGSLLPSSKSHSEIIGVGSLIPARSHTFVKIDHEFLRSFPPFG